VIRQAISCDICGAEKKQTNHWFVAHENGGEMRVSGWNSRNRMRLGSKHLCGQTCLHKLVDDFMARDVAARMQRGIPDDVDLDEQVASTDASLTSDAAYLVRESPVRLPTPVAATLPKHAAAAASSPLGISAASAPSPVPGHAPSPAPSHLPRINGAELVAMPAKSRLDAVATQIDEPPGFRSRNLRAEAWDRERERELRSSGQRSDIAPRRRSGLS
jgi:hypothetical protein